MVSPQVRYTKTSDGVRIAYTTMGRGPAIVYMPPMPWTHVELEWQVEDLRRSQEAVAGAATFVRYDGRGFGLSDGAATDFSAEAMVVDLEAVAGATELRPFILVASLYIAIPALMYAARHPESVLALILWLGVRRGEDALGSRRATFLDLASTDWEFYKEAASNHVGFEKTSAHQAFKRLIDQAATQENTIAFHKSTQTWEATDDVLASVTTPALVLCRRESTSPSPEACRDLAAALPNADFVTLEGSAAALTTPDAAAAVLPFIARTFARTTPPHDATTPPPGAFRTVLFTDLVGHTEMMQRLGDAKGRDVLREHERITRETLKAHGGHEIKTDGDSFMVSFGSVTSAVECAIALQRAFAAHNEGADEALHVRIGLNAGEPVEEDGDLFGAAVILASRIAAKAGAGEILVPDTVRGLLSGKGFVFSDHGEFLPKGFDEGVRLWDVRWTE